MTSKLSIEQIRDYWTRQAKMHGQSPSASWSDSVVIEMEISEILKRLSDDDLVLDLGCANGYSSAQFASQKRVHIRGLDYIHEMIDQARLRLSHMNDMLLGTAEFDVGDITDLKEPAGHYDKVIVIRVIINLGEWDNQLKALTECSRVLKKGGMLLLSEATLQGWRKLNKIRREWELEDIPMPPFNNYLDEEKVINALSADLELVEVANFASTYYAGTRLLKPLLIKALGSRVDVADPNMEWNRLFGTLPSWGDYGVQKLFVFRKK